MVVRLHLDRVVDALVVAAPHAIGGVGEEASPGAALDHGGVVAVRRQRMRRRLPVSVLDHAEQGLVLFLAVHRPAGVEHLVPAVLGVGLGEHEKFGVGGVAAQLGVALDQVVDLVVGQGQTQPRIGLLQRLLRLRAQRHVHQITGMAGQEQAPRIVQPGQHRLRHRVMQQIHDRRVIRRAGIGQAADLPGQPALDAAHVETRAMQDVGGLARPRRDRAQPRHHPQRGRLRSGILRLQHGQQALALLAFGRRVHVEHEHMPGGLHAHTPVHGVEPCIESFEAERREGALPVECDHAGRGRCAEETPILPQCCNTA